jgi:hypothetical protein
MNTIIDVMSIISTGIRSNMIMSGAREIGHIQRSTGMWRKVFIHLIGELVHR